MGEILPNARTAEKNYVGKISEVLIEKTEFFSKTRFLAYDAIRPGPVGVPPLSGRLENWEIG
ncbi:hypothetical protein U27_02950 [Candidatus Vecturithrix granuli]|uniref:Uncharacterized protein n=1 Tax=Vecturithrix granuli TaxID=1499967 RepID=A0A081BUI4_VECG1|nr:hypothetical protein U27_02950 [Candidatus Vecturithrix granuli]